ncbi:MAG: hypothetical protein ABG776_22060, partial [Cyanobacteria bacterium J06555_13]
MKKISPFKRKVLEILVDPTLNFVTFAVLAAGIIFLLFGVGLPYLWRIPVREAEEIQKRLPSNEKLNAIEMSEFIEKRRNTLINGVGPAATTVGVIVLVLNYWLADERLKLDRNKVNSENRRAESIITSEQFARGIEQLGSESIHIRLGGIYSLENLAKDSPKDHWTVMEVLTAFVRQESPLSPSNPRIQNNESIDIDVQTALTVITRREDATEPEQLDLSNSYLRGANLQKGKLDSVNFAGSCLAEA